MGFWLGALDGEELLGDSEGDELLGDSVGVKVGDELIGASVGVLEGEELLGDSVGEGVCTATEYVFQRPSSLVGSASAQQRQPHLRMSECMNVLQPYIPAATAHISELAK